MKTGPRPGWRGTLAERFEQKTIPEPNSGCLLWTGAAHGRGYGVIWDGVKRNYATHIALRLAGQTVPDGKDVLHHCDNTYCVNVDHLFVGDAKANVEDMMMKGRQNFTGLELGREMRWR